MAKTVKPRRGRPRTTHYEISVCVNMNPADKQILTEAYDHFVKRQGILRPDGGMRCRNDWLRAQLLIAAKNEMQKI